MTQVPRVVIFSHSSSLGGGGEGALLELIHDIHSKTELSVVLPGNGSLLKILKSRKVPTKLIKLPWWTEGDISTDLPERSVSGLIETIQYLQSIRPDVCITNTSVLPWGAYAARILGIPHLWFIHEMLDEKSEIKYSLNLSSIKRYIGELSQHVIANSEYCHRSLAEEIPNEKLMLLPPVSHLPSIGDISSLRRPELYRTLPKQELILIVVGRILETKGQIDAVKAVKYLLDRDVYVQLVLLGDIEPSYRTKLVSYARDNSIQDRVHFHEFVENPYPFIAHADIVINTSRLESFGRSTIESMYLGKPVIGANNSSTAVIVKSGVNGLLYDTGDEISLANAIIRYAGDKKLQKKVSVEGRRYAETQQRIAKQSTEDIIKSIRSTSLGERLSRDNASSYPTQLVTELLENHAELMAQSAASGTHKANLLPRVVGKINHIRRRK